MLHQVNPNTKSHKRLWGDFHCTMAANPRGRPTTMGCSAPSEAGAAARRTPGNPGPEAGDPRISTACDAQFMTSICEVAFRRITIEFSRRRLAAMNISHTHGSSCMPNGRTANANRPKQTTVMPMLASMVSQKPSRGRRNGNARNMGNVGTTHQNVYHA